MKKGIKKKNDNKLEKKGVFTLFGEAKWDSSFVEIYHHQKILLLMGILSSKESYKNSDQNFIRPKKLFSTKFEKIFQDFLLKDFHL